MWGLQRIFGKSVSMSLLATCLAGWVASLSSTLQSSYNGTTTHNPTKNQPRCPHLSGSQTQGHGKTNGHCFNIRCHRHHDHSVHLRQYCMIRFFMAKAICTCSLTITPFWIKILMLGGGGAKYRLCWLIILESDWSFLQRSS